MHVLTVKLLKKRHKMPTATVQHQKMVVWPYIVDYTSPIQDSQRQPIIVQLQVTAVPSFEIQA